MASRRRARERAMQMLFQWDLSKDSPEKVVELFWGNWRRGIRESPWNLKKEPLPPPKEEQDESLQSFANELFAGTAAAADEIDAVIRRHAEHWRLERMAAVDRNILRLGIYELTHCPETPPVVVINEALEIARKFSEEESVGFINGLLDQIRKDVEAGGSNLLQDGRGTGATHE
ncbi:MAG: transcription antitermination factor NusB [Acidobacteria bacterium]|nr:transcription antitermination factor NusB [Acidobacteriota bacterium]